MKRAFMALALGIALVSPAAADVELVDGSSVDQIVKLLGEGGYKVTVEKAENGNPRIQNADKANAFTVQFYRCEDGKGCGHIQFVSAWDLKSGTTAEKVGAWNAEKVFTQAYLDDDKDPWLGLVVNLKGGISKENFLDSINWWKEMRAEFEKHIGFRK